MEVEKMKYSGIWNPTIGNLETFEIWTFWRSDFKRTDLNYGYSPNHSKTRPLKIWMFLSGFQMVYDKMAALCLDFKIQTICNPTSFGPFKIQTRSDFSSHCLCFENICWFLIELYALLRYNGDLNNKNIWIMDFYLSSI